MKTFSGTFNGQKYMGVEKPEDSRGFEIKKPYLSRILFCWEGNSPNMQPWSYKLPKGEYEILGTYHTKGEIDFYVDEAELIDLVECNKYGDLRDYSKSDNFDSEFMLKDSICSLLDRDSRMAFPLEENPYGDKPEYLKTGAFDEATTNQQIINVWREAESQVRPKSFLIILVK